MMHSCIAENQILAYVSMSYKSFKKLYVDKFA